MTITWTKCSERMPPDDGCRIIVKSLVDNKFYDGYLVMLEYFIFFHPEDNFEWTPYTLEAWAELNRK